MNDDCPIERTPLPAQQEFVASVLIYLTMTGLLGVLLLGIAAVNFL